jgi:hypothetical protein
MSPSAMFVIAVTPTERTEIVLRAFRAGKGWTSIGVEVAG